MEKLNKSKQDFKWDRNFVDFSITLGAFFSATAICALIHQQNSGGSIAASMVFILTVLLVARSTRGYVWGIACSFAGVLVVNYIFTYPFWELNFSITGYPLMFLTMLLVSIITSASSTTIKQQDELKLANEKERIRSNLLRAISHDIRTPLTSIVGSTSVLMDSDATLTDEQKKELLLNVHDDAEWLISVTENILSITRIDGDTQIKKKSELAEEVIESSVRKFSKRHSNIPKIEINIPSEPMLIPMDIVLIEQVILNLLENAYIHGKTTTQITISLEKQDEFVGFSVANDGVPIPTGLLDVIFDGRIKTDNNLDDNRCMGIGLAVCKTIVNAHGGIIFARNLEDDRGVEFKFTLPIERGDE